MLERMTPPVHVYRITSSPPPAGCVFCLYWKARGDDSRFGECRRSSPYIDPRTAPVATWPVTEKSDYCGEFELCQGE